KDKPSKDFVSDAFAHAKFIAYNSPAMALLKAAGIGEDLDDGCLELGGSDSAEAFVKKCRKLRFWDREAVLQA
ncbi:hypothetical protein, partial [Sulfitobacter sp. HI0129]